MPFGLDFTAEGGTNGNPVSASDTGNGDAPDSVIIGTGATFAYDNSTAATGSQSVQVATSATAANCFLRWSSTIGSRFLPTTHLWASAYFKFTAAPAASIPVLFVRTRLDQGAIAVRVHTDGHLRIYDASNVLVATSNSVIPFNSWFRVDAFFQASPTMGICTLYLFNTPTSTTPDEIIQGGGIAGDDSTFTGFRAGICGGNVASVGPFWMDEPRINNVGFVSPAALTFQTITLIDLGAGNDSLAVSAAVGLADSGVAAEMFGDSASVALPDSGIGADDILVAIAAVLTDSGTGIDTLSATQPKTLTDSGSGVDSIVVSVIASMGDLGEGVDSVVQYFKLTDSGQGSDAAVVAVTVTLADSGSGTDFLQASPVTIVNLSDAGAGTDTLVAISDNTNTVALTDSGIGADSLAVSPVLSLADTGIGIDAIVLSVQMWLGYDDPVPEGHEPFDLGLSEEIVMAGFLPASPYPRASVTIVAQSWKMSSAAFLAHMRHMHAGMDPFRHSEIHGNGGEGGYIRHIHR